MTKKSLYGAGVLVLSFVAVLGVGATLVFAAIVNGNTNANSNTNANANTNTSTTVQRPRGDFDNDGVGLSKTNKASSLQEIQYLLESFVCTNCTDPADRPAKHALACAAASNVNGDAKVDANDAIYAIQYVFGTGPAPVGTTLVTCPKPSATPTPTPSATPRATP